MHHTADLEDYLSFEMEKLLHIFFEGLRYFLLGRLGSEIGGPRGHADFQLDHRQLSHRLRAESFSKEENINRVNSLICPDYP